MGREEAESDRRRPPLHQALCLMLVSPTLMAILSVQSSCAHFIDEGIEAHKVNAGSGGENWEKVKELRKEEIGSHSHGYLRRPYK